ncbi:Ankyrin-3 [Orchesella cincta]|uniref:Ankyrin-3 n=1 Tax=Orchesella cincta TaxID=48709 RepID=A0A1D2M9F6_ORCCI|nr:Ankyrin-3 [Orchesella cincta]
MAEEESKEPVKPSTAPALEPPKSRIPVPASIYTGTTRSGYLADLSGQVYADEEEELSPFTTRPPPRRGRPLTSRQFSDQSHDQYGPPGILHETIGPSPRRGGGGRRRGLRRRTSSEFGDSSIELLGPSGTMDIDETDSTDELLTESLRESGETATGSSDEFGESVVGGGERGSSTFQRYSEKKGGKQQRVITKSKTVGEGATHPNDELEEDDRKHRDSSDPSPAGGERKKRDRRERSDPRRDRDDRREPGDSRRRERDSSDPKSGGWERVEAVGERKKRERRERSDPKEARRDRDRERDQSDSKSRSRGRDTSEPKSGGWERVEAGGERKRDKREQSNPKDTSDTRRDERKKGRQLSQQGKEKQKKLSQKWQREPGRPLDTSRTPSRTPSKSPGKTPGKAKSPAPGGGKLPSFSPSPKRYPPKEGAIEKVELWKKDVEQKGGKLGADGKMIPTPQGALKPGQSPKKDWDRVSAPNVAKGPTTKDPKSPQRGNKTGPDGIDRKHKDKEGGGKGVEWDPETEKFEEDEWKKSSKPPAVRLDTEGMDPAQLEEKMKEDAIRDTAAGMRLLQLSSQGIDEGTGWTPLMYAIKDNRVQIADRLLEMGCDVNAKAKDGLCPIHLAAIHGRDDTIRFLIFKKADLSVVTEGKKQNILHIACSRSGGNNASILRALLAAMPKESRLQKDADGNIPLFVALKNGLRGACQELLAGQAEAQLSMNSGPLDDSPLHLAVKKKDLEIARIFVDAGANVDAVNNLGQTCLHIAAEIGDENFCKFFYLVKANPHLADKEDRTPIHLAAMNGHTNLIDLFADKFKVSVFERTRDGSTLMHIASLHGHPETAMALFRKGVPLQMPNKGGARSIHIAARHGHAAMIAKLLEKGEKVDSVTNDNFTALHIAVEAVRPNVVETLLGYGAEVHIKGGKDQETPLHIGARVLGGEKCALMLLKSGANPNITMENGETPLHVAARHGRLKIIRLMLEDGANPQQRGKDGDTPLHFACRYGHIRVVQELLDYVKKVKSQNECQLYINCVTTKGESALHHAAKLSAKKIHLSESELDLKRETIGRDIVKLLLDGGASVSRQTKETNETVFHYASKEGNNDILVEMLSRLSTVECQRALNKQSTKGWSPLLIASRRGHTAAVETLLEYHARVDVFDTEGRSGLHLAAENGYQEICGILLEHKAFINAKSRVGLTALHYAAMKGFSKLCLFLIHEHGAAVDALTLKKQTPLHLAAENGQLEVCRLLMGLRASSDATDDKGQKPIHLAAQNNHANVIKLFLKSSSALVSSYTKDGSTCAHLAAMQGSIAVLEELMKFDKQGVINARNLSTDATALQLAAEGGHAELVKALLKAGASASDENRAGYTAAHLAAKNGHTNVLEALRNAQEDSINLISRKLGMSALHIAAYYGQTETVRELLQFIPATSGTDPPLTVATAFIRELGTESKMTPLHMAAYSGEENVVRLLLNFEGVQADAPTQNFGFNPLHLACRGGHTTVVGLLLSRSSELLESKDESGKSSLHIAAVNGHKHMVEVLLGQGGEIDAIDKELWTPLICAAKAGHLDVVKLLVESGASPLAKTSKGQSAIWFAAAENHNDVLSYLMKKEHDTYGLLEDKDFVFNLTVCGKNIDNEPIDEFVLLSPAPVDVAAKMSSFPSLRFHQRKRASQRLNRCSKHCEAMAAELLALAAGAESAGKVLGAVDRKGMEFLDVLIDNEQKEVIAHTVVQRHLQEIWVGQLEWADWKLLLLFFSFVFVPPVWITFSLPFGPRHHNIPIVKFMSYLTSHIHLMILLCLTCVTPIHPVFPIRSNLMPYWFETMLFIWLGGLLVAELHNPSDKSGLGWIKVAVLVSCYCGLILHCVAFALDKASYGTVLYIRDQLLGLGILLACVQILDFLSFHYLFGPWAIIIGNLMKDLARFLAVLAIFMVGFSLVMAALNHPIHPRRKQLPEDKIPKTLTSGLPSGVLVTPIDAFELLFFALFGLNSANEMKVEVLGQPEWTIVLFKIFFGVYLLVTVIVLINLLIAMMSDTYQRIEAQSDIEWKFGLAKLIRSMHRTTATPSPLNLLIDWGNWMYKKYKKWREPSKALKWGAGEGEGEGEEDGEKSDGPKVVKISPRERWQNIFQKMQVTNRAASDMGVSNTQLGALIGVGGSLHGSGFGGSTLSAGGSQRHRIEMVTDWHLIAKKYRILVGKEEPVEEHDGSNDHGSGNHHGSSSHMGSSMMVHSKQQM